MQVKCLVVMVLNHDNNTYAIGSEAMLPLDIAQGLESQGVVKIVQKPAQGKETAAVAIPEVVTETVVENALPTAKKKTT